VRRFVPFLFLLACGAKHPPENALRVANPGEPCYEHPHPWDDPPAGLNMNTSNLPQCASRDFKYDTLGRWTFNPDAGPLFARDAGRD